MSENVILKEKKNKIGYITLNRPDAYNTFTPEFAEQLNDTLKEYDADKDVVVVVIRGAGKHFSTGIALESFDEKPHEDYREFIKVMDMHNHTIANMKKPVISSIRGFCLANGAGLSFACDLTIASDKCKIGTTAIKVGLICTGPGVPLMSLVGRKKALEMVLMGEMINSDQAQELGLVNWVVPDDELEDKTDEIAAKLAAKSPLALAAGKRGLYGTQNMNYHPSIDYGTEMFAGLCSTEDAKEGVKAFLEKREPEWKLK